MNDAWRGPTGEPLKGRVFFKELNPNYQCWVILAESPKKHTSVDLSKLFCSVSPVTSLVLQSMEGLPQNASWLQEKGGKACMEG